MTTTTSARPDEQPPTGPEHDHRTPPQPHHQSTSNPSGLAGASNEPDLAAILDNIVADEAPRLFAIVQTHNERLDAQIAAWGLAFDNHAEVISTTHNTRGSLNTPEDALLLFDQDSHSHPRLAWLNPNAATPPEGRDA